MTKNKSTKHALFTSVLALIMCVSMFVGSTFAWFTDEVTSKSNKIQAGTLKIDLELLDKESGNFNSIKEEKTQIFNYDKWEPGYTDVKILKVENEGTLALKWFAKFISEEELTELANVIDVYVCPSETEALAYPTSRTLEGYTHVGTVADFVNTISTTTYGSLEAGKTAYLGIALKMQESAGNEYQGMELGAFDIQILATQLTSEEDSFNNQYDKDAEYLENNVSFVNVSNATELQKALDEAIGNTVIYFVDDITGDVTVTQKNNVKIVINGNNKTFNGVISVDGKSARYENAALTIQNVNFDADSLSADAYVALGRTTSSRYTNNVTVKDCIFSGSNETFVAVKSYNGGDWNVTIEGCTVNEGMHSLAQLKNVEKGLEIVGCKVFSKNGVNTNNSFSMYMSDCEFDVKGYAVRFGSDAGVYDREFTIENSTLKSDCAETDDAVIEFRAGSVESTLTLKNTTLEGNTWYKGTTGATTIIIL